MLWVKSLSGIVGFHTLPLVNADGFWILFSSDIHRLKVPSEISTVHYQIQSSK